MHNTYFAAALLTAANAVQVDTQDGYGAGFATYLPDFSKYYSYGNPYAYGRTDEAHYGYPVYHHDEEAVEQKKPKNKYYRSPWHDIFSSSDSENGHSSDSDDPTNSDSSRSGDSL